MSLSLTQRVKNLLSYQSFDLLERLAAFAIMTPLSCFTSPKLKAEKFTIWRPTILRSMGSSTNIIRINSPETQEV